MKKWRESVSVDKVKALRKLFNDAGVSIYATKTISGNMSDEELDFNFMIAETLGATHTTLELSEDEAVLKRLGDWGLKKKIYVGYHTHLQGSLTAFDKAYATDELAELRAAGAAARPDHLANGLRSFAEGGPVRNQATWEEAKGITAPSLLIHGRDDRVVHFEHTLRLVSTIPDSRAVLLNRCGHWAQIEHADEFNRLVRDFVLNS